MNRRHRLVVTLVTLAVHLLAPIGAYAAPQPAPGSNDFCSAIQPGGGAFVRERATRLNSGGPARHSGHSQHSHCPSCLGASVVLASAPPAAPFVVAPSGLAGVLGDPGRTDVVQRPPLFPPLRGPPAILL
jgi:hypothetical protein